MMSSIQKSSHCAKGIWAFVGLCSSRTNYSTCSLPRMIISADRVEAEASGSSSWLGGGRDGRVDALNNIFLSFAFSYCKKHKKIFQKYLSPNPSQQRSHPPRHFMQYVYLGSCWQHRCFMLPPTSTHGISMTHFLDINIAYG